MKILKKSMAVVLSVIMVCTAMFAGISVLADSNTATVTVGTVAGTKGENVAVPITFTTSSGLWGIAVDVTLAEGLSYVSYTGSNDFNFEVDEDNNVVSFIAYAKGNTDITGTDVALITLTLAVSSQTQASSLAVTAALGEAGSTNINEDTVVTSFVAGAVTLACSHTSTHIENAVAATCTTDGYTGDTVCDDCGETVASGSVIPATGHGTTHIENAVAATCTENGYTGDEVCDVCHQVVQAGSQIPATNHVNTRVINAVAATCSTDGYTGDTYCDDCNQVVATGAVIPATGAHTFTNPANTCEVSFTAAGIAYGKTCTACGTFVQESADTSASAVTASSTVRGFQSYGAIYTTATGTVAIPYTLPAGKTSSDIHLAYIDENNAIIGNALHSASSAFNPIEFVSYAEGVVTVDTDVTGTIVVYTLENSTALDYVLSQASLSTTFAAESRTELRFLLTKSRLKYNNAEVFTGYYSIIEHQAYTYKDTTNAMHISTTRLAVDEANSTATHYYFSYGVAPAEMSDNVSCYFYGVYEGVNYLIRVKADYSVIAYSESSVGFASSDAKFRTMLADMLYYADTCQRVFVYHTDAYIMDNPTTSANIEANRSAHAANLNDLEVVVSSSNSGYQGSTKLFGFAKTFAAESRTELRFVVNFKTGFAGVYGDAAIQNVYYKFSIDGVMQDGIITYEDVIAKNAAAYDSASKKLTVSCDTLKATQFASEVVLYGFYDDFTGTAPAGATHDEIFNSTYSINTYAKAQYGTATLARNSYDDLTQAMYYYGAAAYEYFPK